MAKQIRLTSSDIEKVKLDFEKYLSGATLSDGKFTFSTVVGDVNRKAKVIYTESAWQKQSALVREFDKEVAWHGIATREDDMDGKDVYMIRDIVVYPQEVTGSTVNTDQQKYEEWIMEFDDDIFNALKMQGHSHVNMGTSPSSVDVEHQEKIIEQLDDDSFYIFMIWNKKNERTIRIYDMRKNLYFTGSDIDVSIQIEDGGLMTFLDEARKMVIEKKYEVKKQQTAPAYNGYYSRNKSSYDDDYDKWSDYYSTGKWKGYFND